MTDFLFDTPWWLPALIAAAGVVVFVTGNNRLERNVKLGGLGLIALAVLLGAVSYFVDTAKETAERRSQALVDAFERADWPAMTAILDPNAALSVLSSPVYDSREKIVERARAVHGSYGFRSVNVIGMDAQQVDTVITVNVRLMSEQDAAGYPMPSTWEFQWQQTADGWALVDVRAISIGQWSGEQIRTLFPGR